MKKIDIVLLHDNLENVKNIGGAKWKYMILKNLKVIEPEYEPLKQTKDDVKSILKDFQEEKSNYIIENGIKEPDGSIHIDTNSQDAIDAFMKFNNEIQEKYKSDITKFESESSKYNDVLNEDFDTEFDWYVLKNVDDIPDDVDANSLELFMKYGIVE